MSPRYARLSCSRTCHRLKDAQRVVLRLTRVIRGFSEAISEKQGLTIEHAEVQVKLNELAEKVGGWRSMSDAYFQVFVDRYMNGNFLLKYTLDDHEVFQQELKRRVDEDIIDTVPPPKRERLLKRLC